MADSQIHPDIARLAYPVDRLEPLPGNPRRGDVDAVARSYARFGQRKPIVARREGDRAVVLAGNHQLAAAKQLGWPQIAVVWTDDDDAAAKAYALADNQTGLLGGYDDAALGELLRDVQATDDLELLAATGFGSDEVARLLAAAETRPALTDPDDAPPLPAKPRTEAGDLWLLGPHRLLCGDSTDHASFDRLLGGRLADMVWTDPPYGVDVAGGSHDPRSKSYRSGDTLTNDNLDPASLADFLRRVLTLTSEASRPGATWFVASPSGDLMGVFGNVLTDLRIWRHTIIWVKDSFVFSRCDYHYQHETIFFGWKLGAGHQQVTDRSQSSVWQIPRPKRSAEHPTMKPVALVARAVDNHTRPGDLVLDPFAGSGSTLIAANGAQRLAALIELDPVYCDVICRRWQEHTGDKPILEATGEPHDFTGDAS